MDRWHSRSKTSRSETTSAGRAPTALRRSTSACSSTSTRTRIRCRTTSLTDIVESIRQALLTVNRYPDREFTELRESLADYLGHGLTAEQLWAANGSNEVIQQLLQAFGGPGRTVLGFPPTYSMHSILASGTGTTWIPAAAGRRVPHLARDRRGGDPCSTSRTSCSCAGRTTRRARRSTIETIEAAYDATDGIVMVDEAYAEFMPSDAPSALTLLPGRERLVVSRTMSKAFAFAGARVGYMAAHPAVDRRRSGSSGCRTTCPP